MMRCIISGSVTESLEMFVTKLQPQPLIFLRLDFEYFFSHFTVCNVPVRREFI
jgi:hypothetical protein